MAYKIAFSGYVDQRQSFESEGKFISGPSMGTELVMPRYIESDDDKQSAYLEGLGDLEFSVKVIISTKTPSPKRSH